jgi:hypothetical protein
LINLDSPLQKPKGQNPAIAHALHNLFFGLPFISFFALIFHHPAGRHGFPLCS